MARRLLGEPGVRKIALRFLGKNRFFWKIVGLVLRSMKVKMRRDDCIFCKIVKGEIQANKVYEDDSVIVFHDISPQAPVHVLVIPKKHIPTLLDISDEDKDTVLNMIKACNEVAKKLNIAERGFRLIVNTNPEGGQYIYHLHIHMIGGRQMRWPPG